MSGLFTNYRFLVGPLDGPPGNRYYSVNALNDITINNQSVCFCSTTPRCTIPAYVNNDMLHRVPGIFFGCYMVEALSQSSLSCFYDQLCVNNLIQVLVPNITSNIPALNSTVPSRYQINSTLDEIINQVMVEQWSNSTSHEAYYDQCNPAVCTYSYVGKNGLITIITTIIEVIGGLSVILKLIVPKVIKLIRSPRQNNTGMMHPYM
ncbi:unnamed protein product [Rotaria sp. Silwood2]|nr:unnamed protein product [Rotaria sp. Silwood2]CAF2984708.1 unnamed protein product [Rotaria sp. Silwood2]CAF4059953.1 unnamed protein product [Rotaria sp. Silwood2]CAF4364049.1 unnamed protein product [Rotaria sp. Silwood2]